MDPLDEAVHDGLEARGHEVSWEHPGALVIQVTPTYEVWTGLNGYHYGTANYFDGDMWQPDEHNAAEPDGLFPDVADAEMIIDAWAAWVQAYREKGSA